MVLALCSVESLCVTDSTSGDGQRKIVSLAENTDKASSLEVNTHSHYTSPIPYALHIIIELLVRDESVA